MQQEKNVARVMPDVALGAVPQAAALDWVGMENIDVPVVIADVGESHIRTPARVAAFVNLSDPAARGIHMSRLYGLIDKTFAEAITPGAIRHLLREFVESHSTLADRALLRISLDQLIRRPALKSANSGWKSYPIVLSGQLQSGQCDVELAFQVEYSSTCPASAALARQLIQENFQRDFARDASIDFDKVVAWLGSEEGICATPHSQRSVADVKVKLGSAFAFPIVDLIDRVESALKTPVQTAVKREDEQEFALLNGGNLMFCEDAARRIHAALDTDERVVDFCVRTAHLESLHPHDAVAFASKGVAAGYRSDATAFGA